MSNMDVAVFIVIPGHDDHIPRKYLRKLENKFLFSYIVDVAKLVCQSDQDIFVLTDDEEVELYAQRMGVGTYYFNSVLEALPGKFNEKRVLKLLNQREQEKQSSYQYVSWCSPDYPLVSAPDMQQAILELERMSVDAMFTVSEKRNAAWAYTDTYQPNFSYVENNQQEVMHRELGAFFIMDRLAIDVERGFIGDQARAFFIPAQRALRIESTVDFGTAHQLLNRKKLLFVVTGYPEVGMGHVYRALQIAQSFLHHEVLFLCDSKSQEAYKKIKEFRYSVWLQKNTQTLSSSIMRLKPDVVINDILDTPKNYIQSLKSAGLKVINFEDQGEGAPLADLVINALHDSSSNNNELIGPDYMDIRDEFLNAPNFIVRKQVKNILLTLGGADHGNLTQVLSKGLLDFARENEIKITAITGPAYQHEKLFEEFLFSLDKQNAGVVEWIKGGTKQMSKFLLNADLVILSAGRTVYELAYMGVPGIVLATNQRETTHRFAKNYGMCYLGLCDSVDIDDVLNALESLLPEQARVKMHKVLTQGAWRHKRQDIIRAIEKVYE